MPLLGRLHRPFQGHISHKKRAFLLLSACFMEELRSKQGERQECCYVPSACSCRGKPGGSSQRRSASYCRGRRGESLKLVLLGRLLMNWNNCHTNRYTIPRHCRSYHKCPARSLLSSLRCAFCCRYYHCTMPRLLQCRCRYTRSPCSCCPRKRQIPIPPPWAF